LGNGCPNHAEIPNHFEGTPRAMTPLQMKIQALLGSLFLVGCSVGVEAAKSKLAPATDGGADPANAAASAEDSTTGPSTNVSPEVAAASCVTPHRTFDVAPVDFYRRFESSADALATLPTPSPAYLPAGNDLEAHAAAITAKVFAAYQKLYPEAVKGMPVPVALIQDSDEVNAHVLGAVKWTDGTAPSVPWAFVYDRGFLEKADDNQAAFITGHELGHLVLRNTTKKYFPSIYYRERTPSDRIFYGPDLKDDTATRATAAQVIAAGSRVGQLFATELNGVGTQVGANNFTEQYNIIPLYNRTLIYLHQTYAKNTATPAKCMAAKQERDQIRTFVSQHFSKMEGKLDFGTDSATVDQLTKQFAADESTCLAHVKMSLQDAVNETLASDDSSSNDDVQFTQAEQDADASDPTGNVVTKILTLGRELQDSMNTLENDPQVDFQSIRVLTAEDDADESGVRILKLLGITVTQGFGLTLEQTPDDDAACTATINAGKIPAYAGVIDPHHSTCWRKYRNLKLEKALSSCNATWPQ
jgi:hypothetical protein